MNAVRSARTEVADAEAAVVSQSPRPASKTSLAVAATPFGGGPPRSSGYVTPDVAATSVVEAARSTVFVASVVRRASVAAGILEQAVATSTITSTAAAIRTLSRTPPSSSDCSGRSAARLPTHMIPPAPGHDRGRGMGRACRIRTGDPMLPKQVGHLTER